MFNKLFRRAISAAMVLGLVTLAGCGSAGTSDSISADASKKTKIVTTSPSTGGSTTTTTTTTTTTASGSNPMTGQSPGLGAPDIATTDHNVLDDLEPSWGTGVIAPSNTGDVDGAFRFVCRHTNLAFDDPTVYPSQPGVSHLHDESGVNGWNAYSNYGNLRTSGGGSGCNDVAAFDHNTSEASHAANRTPYWQPALLDGKGNAVLPDYTVFYYKRRPSSDPVVSDPSNPKYAGKAVPLPNGLKFIFGAFPENSSKTPTFQFTFSCVGSTNQPDQNNLSFAQAVQCAKDNASYGAQLDIRGSAPDCWDGINLDTSDHRSHLAYGGYGDWGYYKCDAAHPYVIPSFTYIAFYTILPSDTGDIHFSSDEMDNTKPRGWSFHVDYGPASWDPTVMAMWTNNCIEKLLNCSGGDLGNGLQLKGAEEPRYLINGVWTASWRNPVRLVPIPPASTM